MKLIVGLGNPGQKYKGTRHNIGFEVLASLAERYDVGRPKSKFQGEVAETIIENEKAVLLSPLTYMNLSGQSVRAAIDFYKIPLTDLIVICDDLALDVARLRLRQKGSAGGQNGLKDIINRLGSQEFPRLRVGIGKPPPEWDTGDYVLSRFNDQEHPLIEKAVSQSTQAIEVWIGKGIQIAMNQFNSNPNKKPKNKVKKSAKQDPASSDSTKTTDDIKENK